MARKVNPGPLQRLSGHVAQPGELREMSRSERRARTCKVCDITYRSARDAADCQRWHAGKGA